MRPAFIVTALAFAVPILGVPTVVPITKHAGPVKPDSYIVKLKDGASKNAVLDLLRVVLGLAGSLITLDDCQIFPGFISILKGDALTYVQRMQEVEYIEQDRILSLSEHEEDTVYGHWHSSSAAPSHHDTLVGRTDETTACGSDVTIYGIDTGIYTEHSCFGGRAGFGASFVGEADGESDRNGHGTHTAATAAGKRYGLATCAKIVAVKVLDGSGSGSTSGVIQGVCWAFKDFKDRGMKPSVATMSLGGPVSPSLDLAVSKAIECGLHFTVAAGNSNVDASTTSPARVERANTIGAIDSNNTKAYFSNYGPLIDVWALGVNVLSAWIGGPNEENTISGTSMATPSVAGIIACKLSECPNMRIPSIMSGQLKNNTLNDVTFVDPADKIAGMTSTHGHAQLWPGCTLK